MVGSKGEKLRQRPKNSAVRIQMERTMKFKIVNLVLALALLMAVGAAYATHPGHEGHGVGHVSHGQGNGYGHDKKLNFSPD